MKDDNNTNNNNNNNNNDERITTSQQLEKLNEKFIDMNVYLMNLEKFELILLKLIYLLNQ